MSAPTPSQADVQEQAHATSKTSATIGTIQNQLPAKLKQDTQDTQDTGHPPLFDYAAMDWELDGVPDPSYYNLSTQLFHLYLISGHLTIGKWPINAQLAGGNNTYGRPYNCGHIVGWAPIVLEHPLQ